MLQAWIMIAVGAEEQLRVTQHLSRDEALAHFTELQADGRAAWGTVYVMRDGVLQFEMRLPTGPA